ncbi:hypothetical protein COY07_03220 [Candidatus Peregrinibacteria bacterium CG_4_10_14_0_2_um_filter_43_11]|nr:MAG: hypothetical protein COY07_03220 [Candidatus Peregrinibacteria bacterium CG_4_10_14_0_2_um_filter_43_11]
MFSSFYNNRWLKFGLLLLVTVLAFRLLSPDTFAQLAVPNSELINRDIVTNKTFGQAVLTMVNYFIGLLGFLATLAFIYAGVLWVLNGGNEDLIGKAKKIMTYASLGLIVIMLSYTVVRFIVASVDESPDTSLQSGIECAYGFDAECPEGEWCVLDKTTDKYSCTAHVKDIFDAECVINEQCSDNQVCAQLTCKDPNDPSVLDLECTSATECNFMNGEVCWMNKCQEPPKPPAKPFECFASFQCKTGEYCAVGVCKPANDTTCTTSNDCPSPKTCDDYGLCRNPNAESVTTCDDSTDCASGFVCNQKFKKCEFQGSGPVGITGGPASAVAESNLTAISDLITELDAALDGIATSINALPKKEKEAVKSILSKGSLADKLAQLEEMLDATEDPAVSEVLERLIGALTRLSLLREEVDVLRTVMPESKETIQLWDKTSEALDALIDNPDSVIKLRQFETTYNKLKEIIRKFPTVQAKIQAIPGEGNVPFTVTFDGLNSVDPTGGTISDYKWTFLDNSGNEVSLGNAPVVINEFTEPNTYAVNLRVSTAQKDADGYKTAMDGISTVWIKANPPTSQVNFRINGVEAEETHHVTEKEGQAGLIFDPSLTVPALGRVIEQYEWLFGDGDTEIRSTPTTVVHSYQKAGEYFVKLITTDNHGVKDKKIVKLFVKSLAADISINPKEGNVNTQFGFKGLSSRSDDGMIKHYAWTIEAKKGEVVKKNDEQSFLYQFDQPGEYKIILSITDVTGAQDNTIKVLKVASRPPVASFMYTIPEGNHPNRIEFNAINSYDADQGDAIHYSWDFDGDGAFEIVDTEDALVTHEYKKTGDYRVRLQVKDSFKEHSVIEKVVSVDSILSADIFTEHLASQVGEEMTFEVQNSNATAYLWEFGDNTTSSAEEATVTHTYDRKGKYTVRLHFFDAKDNENIDTVRVLIGDGDTPVARASYLINAREQRLTEDLCGAGKDGTIITRADTLLFSAKDSINRDGSTRLLSYDWKFSDGSRSSKKEFNYRFDEVDTLNECSQVGLVVRDEISGQLGEEDLLYFKVVNQLPTVKDFVVESKKEEALITPTKIKLRAINPKDTDGTIKRYRWWYVREGREDEKLGMHNTNTPETEMIVTALGEPNLMNRYFFVLELTDSDGGVYTTEERFKEMSSLEIKNGPNLSPVAEFTMDKTTISVGDSVTLVSQSYDPQGEPLEKEAFHWDFDGDGAFDDVSTGAQVSRQYNTPGEYEIRLKVINRGLSSSVSKRVIVEPTQSLPQAAFTYTVEGARVVFDANTSRFDPDLDDTTLRFEWDFDVAKDMNGNGINDDDVESTEVTPAFTYGQVGTYRVRLKVKDSLGMEGVVVREVDLSLSQEERERNAYYSLKINSPNQPLTSVNLTVTPAQVSKGGTSDVVVQILNADNSPYFGKVFFEVIEGSGEFTPNPVDAQNSKASSVFTATDVGPVRIRVRATDTHYGELTEDATIYVTF